MKILFAIILSVVAFAGSTQSLERKVASQVKEVTIFLKGAQVTRTATVELKPGTSTLVLNGTSPHIQENSIQVEANMGVKMMGAAFRINYLKDLKQSETSIALNKEKERISELIRSEKTSLEIFNEEESMLKANKVIGGQQTGVNVTELKTAVDYYRQRLMDIREHRQQIIARISSYEKDVAKIDAQLNESRVTKPKPEGEIVIKVESKSDARVIFKVSYLVNEASWFPTYDIRAKDIQSPIAITYKANISQQSGEDWENVKLTVSSANPAASGAKPVLQPWILGFNNHNSILVRGVASLQTNNMVSGRVIDETGLGIPGVNIILKGTSNGTTSDANGNYSLALSSGGADGILVFSFIGYTTQEVSIGGRSAVDVSLLVDVTALNEVVVTGYSVDDDGFQGRAAGVQRGASSYREPKIKQTLAATPIVRSTALEFTLEDPYTILSGGESSVVDMIEYEVDATYQYYAAPKLDTDAFLTARLTEWDNYNFLEGQASIFFEGNYIGKTVLYTQNTSDTLNLSLGRDKNVVVTREKKKEYSSNQFVGSNRKSLFAYEINIRNKKSFPINIRIEDQVPVPNTKDISVDNIEDSDAINIEESGLLTWNYKVEPGKTQKIDLRYEVKYPKYSNIILE
jgi:hypothetical protein